MAAYIRGSSKGTVLLVDDDHRVIKFIGSNLSLADLVVVSARNATEGLAKASKVRPDIILLDAALPDMNSLDVCRRLKTNHATKQIPVVLMNFPVEDREIIRCIAAGADDYINKPLDSSELAAVLKANMTRQSLDIVTKPHLNSSESTLIYNRIRTSIVQGRHFAVMYLDIIWPRGFNTRRAIYSRLAMRLLNEIVSEVLQVFGNVEDLMGRFEEDSLVVVTSPQRAGTLCRMIISQFDKRIFDLFGSVEGHLEQGYIPRDSELKRGGDAPLIGVYISVVANDRRKINTPLEVEKLGAELRSYAKCKPGSNYCFLQGHYDPIDGSEIQTANCSPGLGEDTARLRYTLSRICFITKRLGDAMTLIRSSIDSSLSNRVDHLDGQQQRDLRLIVKRAEQLLDILEELNYCSTDIGLASAPFVDSKGLESRIDLTDGFSSCRVDKGTVIYNESG